MSLNEFFGEREPQTTPANVPRLAGTRGVGSIEPLEDMRKGFRGNARAGILNLQRDPPLILVRSSQFDPTAIWGKLQGVFDDVEKDPAQLISIAAQRGQTWRHLVREALAMDLALHLRAYVSQQWGNFNGCEAQLEE